MAKREIKYLGFPVVLGNEMREFDEQREFLVDCLFLYAHKKGRDIKIVFFNGEHEETGVAVIFKNGDDDE